MTGLVEFLRARLDEEADAAQQARWAMQGKWYESADDKLDEFVRMMSPDRVLAEVKANRNIIKLHLPQPWHINAGGFVDIPKGHPICGACGDGEWYAVPAPCPTLAALVQPYANHPDFNQEWNLS